MIRYAEFVFDYRCKIWITSVYLAIQSEIKSEARIRGIMQTEEQANVHLIRETRKIIRVMSTLRYVVGS